MAESVSRREFLRAPWRALAAERPVGRITIDPQRCTLCGACAERCPQGALVLEGGFDQLRIAFDGALCTACGMCLVCPEQALHLETSERQPSPPSVLVADKMVRCSRCGLEVGPARLLAKVLQSAGASAPALCPRCRMLQSMGVLHARARR
jgi:formate hydrogenlyase subunit 6/NADH:ubiquinone oxidoreductase subunit I